MKIFRNIPIHHKEVDELSHQSIGNHMKSISIDPRQFEVGEQEIIIWKGLVSRIPKDELRLVEILLSKHRPLLVDIQKKFPGKVVIPLAYLELSVGRHGHREKLEEVVSRVRKTGTKADRARAYDRLGSLEKICYLEKWRIKIFRDEQSGFVVLQAWLPRGSLPIPEPVIQVQPRPAPLLNEGEILLKIRIDSPHLEEGLNAWLRQIKSGRGTEKKKTRPDTVFADDDLLIFSCYSAGKKVPNTSEVDNERHRKRWEKLFKTIDNGNHSIPSRKGSTVFSKPPNLFVFNPCNCGSCISCRVKLWGMNP